MLTRRTFIASTGALTLGTPNILKGADTPAMSIGLVADAQYADIPEAKTRFYRQSIAKLGDAVEDFNRQDLTFCVHLGDLIDREWRSFSEISKPLASLRPPIHHLLGNHDFDVLGEYKAKVPALLGLTKRYYHFDKAGFRFVMLDSTDISTYTYPTETPEHKVAAAALQQAIAARLPQAQPWNGALGLAQLKWLDGTCAEALSKGLKVILFAHHPVFPANSHNIWNSGEVLTLLDRHRHVVAWFNGHNHEGNFGVHEGLPCVNLRGMVETADTTAYAMAALYADRIIITGKGREPSRELLFRKTT